jgi:tetratricopeptide (TPR) repeat protein
MNRMPRGLRLPVRELCLLALGALGTLQSRPLAGATATALRQLGEPPAAETVEAQTCGRQFESRDYVAARDCFERYLGAHPTDAAAMGTLGRTCLALRRPWRAVHWLEEATRREPARSELHDWLAQAYGTAAERAGVLHQFGLAIKARKQFERAVELDPANLDAREDLIEFQIEAPGFLGGSAERARANAADLESRDRLRGRLAQGSIDLRNLGLAGAEREMLQTAAEFPADPRPRLALGAAYARAGRYDRAFESLESALRLDPDGGDEALELARTAVLAGQRLDRAAELLRAGLKRLPPGDPAALADTHQALGAVLEKQGDAEHALHHYRTAVRLDPDLPPAREALRRLEPLAARRGNP